VPPQDWTRHTRPDRRIIGAPCLGISRSEWMRIPTPAIRPRLEPWPASSGETAAGVSPGMAPPESEYRPSG
jgi:hypothetical protein